MKFTRSFSTKAKGGKIHYSTGPVVPFPVKLRSLTVTLKGDDAEGTKTFEIAHDDAVFLSVTGTSGENFELERPLQLAAGKQIFKVVAGPFTEGSQVDGSVEIEVSVF